MRRSLRRLGHMEVAAYPEGDQLFTTLSLEEAKERLSAVGLNWAGHCFFSWINQGVRYFRVWEDKRLAKTVARPVPFGQAAAMLKRADAEKLYIKAKRYRGSLVRFVTQVGQISVMLADDAPVKVTISLPVTGGSLVFEHGTWSPAQAAHFVNVLLVRDFPVDDAFHEAELLQA